MSFLNIDTGNAFITTIYDIFCYMSLTIIFGYVLNIEYHKKQADEKKRKRKIDRCLRGLYQL